jgi:hypothetical protein
MLFSRNSLSHQPSLLFSPLQKLMDEFTMASVVLFPNQLPARTCPRAFSLSPTLSLPTYASLSKTASRRVQDGPDFERLTVYDYGIASPKDGRLARCGFLPETCYVVICHNYTKKLLMASARHAIAFISPFRSRKSAMQATVMWRLWAWWQVELYQGL